MNIFLTGSTGFLGGKLMKNLVSETDHHLHVLVRNLDKAEQLKACFTEEQQHRIHFLTGDITKENLGLADHELKSLTGNIQAVYHIAALVKFDLDLRDKLFAINYGGTKNVLEFAKHSGVKKFFYVSTAYTVGKSDKGTEDLYSTEAEYHNPYEESKVHSEHLVFSYSDIMEVSIFRPSIIVGDSKTGEADSEFTLYGFMRALDIFKRRVARKKGDQERYRVIANDQGTSNFVPVDYVADVLALAPDHAKRNQIYNIINPNPPTNLEILEMFKKALDFHQLSLVDTFEGSELSEEEIKLNGMVDIFRVYLARNIQFDDQHTQELTQGTDVEHLTLTPETVEMIINQYFRV